MSKWNEVLINIRGWLKRRSAKAVIVLCLVGALIVIPQGARGQFGIDPCCAIISVGLNSISQLLKGAVAQPLSTIQQIEQQNANFHQQVVFPTNAINNARGLVAQLEAPLQGIQQLYRLPVNSATLAAPQQLESMLLSRDAGQIPQLGQVYGAVYGKIMSSTDAPQPVRDMVDMADAEAQAALKKAVQLDALSDLEIQAANKINQQIQTAAPGSAPILEAQAAAWQVRAEAYTQSAMAELVRVHAIELAGGSADLKLAAANTSNMRGNVGNMLGTGAK